MPVINQPLRIPFQLFDSGGNLVIDVVAANYTLRAAIDDTELTLSGPNITIEQRAVGSSDLVLVYTPTAVGHFSTWGLDHTTHQTNMSVSYIEITQYSTDDAVGRLALKAPLIGQDGISGTAIDVYPDTDLEFSFFIPDDDGDPLDLTGKLFNFRVGVLVANGSYNTIYQDTNIVPSQFAVDILVDRVDTKKWENESKLRYFVEEVDGAERWPRAFARLNIINMPKE